MGAGSVWYQVSNFPPVVEMIDLIPIPPSDWLAKPLTSVSNLWRALEGFCPQLSTFIVSRFSTVTSQLHH